jgi:hypothetical protein
VGRILWDENERCNRKNKKNHDKWRFFLISLLNLYFRCFFKRSNTEIVTTSIDFHRLWFKVSLIEFAIE